MSSLMILTTMVEHVYFQFQFFYFCDKEYICVYFVCVHIYIYINKNSANSLTALDSWRFGILDLGGISRFFIRLTVSASWTCHSIKTKQSI